MELEVSGFKTTETTVIAANLGFQTMRSEQERNLELAKEDGEKELEVGIDYPYIIQVSLNVVPPYLNEERGCLKRFGNVALWHTASSLTLQTVSRERSLSWLWAHANRNKRRLVHFESGFCKNPLYVNVIFRFQCYLYFRSITYTKLQRLLVCQVK